MVSFFVLVFFFFNDTATTEIYTLSLHDALPICADLSGTVHGNARSGSPVAIARSKPCTDRKSTRLNSSHVRISYAVFCLKKKRKNDCCSLFMMGPGRPLPIVLLSTSHIRVLSSSFFFFNATATTEIYTLSLHDALPIRPLETLH